MRSTRSPRDSDAVKTPEVPKGAGLLQMVNFVWGDAAAAQLSGSPFLW